jgi:hypothetical protein
MHLDFWDFVTFAVLTACVGIFLFVLTLILALPGKIAIARKHPDADAVNLMGWLGFLGVVPWIQAFFWAFKPTTVIDIRYLPEQERRHIVEMIAQLTAKKSETRPADKPSDGGA